MEPQVGEVLSVEKQSFLEKVKQQKFIKIALLDVILLILITVFFLLYITYQQQQTTQVSDELPAEFSQNMLAIQANEYLSQFAKTGLQATVAPPVTTTMQESEDANGEKTPNRYTATWQTANLGKGFAAIKMQDVSVFDTISVIFVLPQEITAISKDTAIQQVRPYFQIEPQGEWACRNIFLGAKPTIETTLCENFWTDTGTVKKGIEVLSKSEETSTASVFYCALYPGGSTYERESCTHY